jgi:hypothetical protein
VFVFVDKNETEDGKNVSEENEHQPDLGHINIRNEHSPPN